jgi:hypothetical protein
VQWSAGTVVLILFLGALEKSGKLQTPRRFSSGEDDSVSIEQEAEWATAPVCTFLRTENLFVCRDSKPGSYSP